MRERRPFVIATVKNLYFAYGLLALISGLMNLLAPELTSAEWLPVFLQGSLKEPIHTFIRLDSEQRTMGGSLLLGEFAVCLALGLGFYYRQIWAWVLSLLFELYALFLLIFEKHFNVSVILSFKITSFLVAYHIAIFLIVVFHMRYFKAREEGW